MASDPTLVLLMYIVCRLPYPPACFETVTSDSSTTDHKKHRFGQKLRFFHCAKM